MGVAVVVAGVRAAAGPEWREAAAAAVAMAATQVGQLGHGVVQMAAVVKVGVATVAVVAAEVEMVEVALGVAAMEVAAGATEAL